MSGGSEKEIREERNAVKLLEAHVFGFGLFGLVYIPNTLCCPECAILRFEKRASCNRRPALRLSSTLFAK